MPSLSATLLVVALVAVACTGGDEPEPGVAGAGTPGRGAPGRPLSARYVVVGASDAVGYGADDPTTDAWPKVLARTDLPSDAALVNLAMAGATVADALEQELPVALDERPSVALVWLSVNDLLAQVPADTYESQLGALVHALRRGGATRVLVGNTPPLDRLPIYLDAQADPNHANGALPGVDVLNGAVDAYNAAIARIVATEGADLVDLHAATLAARAAGTEAALVGDDGFHPSTTGHKTVAATFAAVLKRPSS